MSNLIPITEMPGTTEMEHGLAWEVSLPEYAPAEQIGINAPLVRRLTRLAGLSDVVITSYDGERDQVSPEVNGMSSDGSITGTMRASHKKAPKSKSDFDTSAGREYRSELRRGLATNQLTDLLAPTATPTTISLNTGLVSQRVSESGNLRSAAGWAQGLNGALAAGLRSTARENLADQTALTMMVGLEGFMLGMSASHGGSLPDHLMAAAVYSPFIYAALGSCLRGSLRDVRYSFVLGAQLDRLLGVQALSATTKLIKPLPA